MEPDEYRRLAAVEDAMWYFRALHAQIEADLTEALGDRAARILDVGCGTGGLIRRLASRHPAWRWTGLDVSPLACALARSRLDPVVEIVQGSAERLPWADASWDAVVAADVLYHVADDGLALREIGRVLRPGGFLIVNEPAYPWLWSYHDEAVHGLRRYTRRDLLRRIQSAGFASAVATYRNMAILPLVAVRRKLLPPAAGGSDVRLGPTAVEAGLGRVAAAERSWLKRVRWLPFGTSVLVVARSGG